jgi:uncharacterized sporulation protein YeaH/YhbH (DUF444 family)
MTFRIGQDIGRFKDIVKRNIKKDLAKYISSDDLISQNGDGKTVKIPVKYINLPKFQFGELDQGGTGSGEGNEGDPISGGKGDKPEKGNKAGDAKGEHDNNEEFAVEELAKMLGEELALPDMEEKNKGKVVSSRNKYNGISNLGAEGLRHFKRTYKEALKRSIASGTYDPQNPIIIPIKADKRYRAGIPITEPNVNTVIIYILDISGSMGEEQRHMAKSVAFWVDAWLSTQYNGIEKRYIVHDTEAKEVNKEEFFSLRESGGTKISSALDLCNNIMKSDYPFSEFNVYPLFFSDGDNYDNNDNVKCIELLRDHIIPNSNVFSYAQTTSMGGSGEFIRILDANFPGHAKVQTAVMNNRDDIMACIKAFLGKGK